MRSDDQRSEPGNWANVGVDRRTALRLLGFGAATGAFMSAGVLPGAKAWAAPVGAPRASVGQWAAERGDRYFVAHRGSGDVLPEHSMEAYVAAAGWGARCLEISVGMTSDGVLICLHDLTYDRTTTAAGPVLTQSSSVAAQARIWQPQLGQGWLDRAPRIPLFSDVLERLGGRVVLAVEAKVDAAFGPMLAMVERYGLTDSVIVKGFHTSRRLIQAKSAGYPVFSYLARVDATVAAVNQAASGLDPRRDYLVIPAFVADLSYTTDDVVAAAVDSGVPVWVYPVHRRSDARHFFDRGVQGAICSSFGYVAERTSPVSADSWAAQVVEPGEMSRNPAVAFYRPTFTPAGELVLAAQNTQHYLTLGQLSPAVIGDLPYTIEVDASWQVLPGADRESLGIAFGRSDDSYYEHRQGRGDGYHAILRADGELGLYRHHDGQISGERLAPSASTPAMSAGSWARLRVEVGGGRIALSRTDTGARVDAVDTTARGGYFHIGRSSPDGVAAFRELKVT